MPLEPTFAVTPLEPIVRYWDVITGETIYYALLNCYGTVLAGTGYPTLENQYNENMAALRHHKIPSPPPNTLFNYWDYSLAHLEFKTNASINNQYLLIFHVYTHVGSARAAFYVNGNLIRSEHVEGEQYIAILVDCPNPQTFTYISMALEQGYTLYFKGIECYII